MRNEVVITGVGLRTPMGNTLQDVRAVFASGTPVVASHAAPDGHLRAVARLTEDYTSAFSRLDRSLIDPVAQLSILAAESAVADAGLDLSTADRERIGVFVGTGQNTAHTFMEGSISLQEKNTLKTFTIARGLANGVANHVSIRLGLQGEAQAIALACASSNTAIGNAVRLIRSGELDGALAGGSDATYSEFIYRGWEAMRMLAPVHPDGAERSCRPFAKDRNGIVLGEGAVIFMLESERQAKARGARILARIAGYGATSDGTHLLQPDAQGQARAMTNGLRDAGLQAQDIQYLNAHGAASTLGDATEVQAIRLAFGSHAHGLPISSTKALHGHMLGATGAAELLALIVALNDGLIAPTANLYEPDPELDLDFVPLHARHGPPLQAAMSSNFAFGGSNACLVLTR